MFSYARCSGFLCIKWAKPIMRDLYLDHHGQVSIPLHFGGHSISRVKDRGGIKFLCPLSSPLMSSEHGRLKEPGFCVISYSSNRCYVRCDNLRMGTKSYQALGNLCYDSITA